MFSIHYIRSVFGYHFWANSQLLKKANNLTESDYFEDLGVGHGSLHSTFFHMLRVEKTWFELAKNGGLNTPPSEINTFPNLQSIQESWTVVEKDYLQYLDRTAEEEYAAVVNVIDQNGIVTPIQRWRMFQQVLFHGAQHRAEAALILTHLGQSPGDLDFIFY